MQKNKDSLLIVDDTPENINVLSSILEQDYQIRAAINGSSALTICQKFPPDLILLDIMLPDIDGYEVCKRLKEQPQTQNIPIIFVSAKDEVEDEEKGFRLGAVDYISKPISAHIVQARVRSHLALYKQQQSLAHQVDIRTQEIQQLNHELKSCLNQTIRTLSGLVERRSSDLEHHVKRVASYSQLLAKLYGLSDDEIYQLYTASPLHDIGMMFIAEDLISYQEVFSEQQKMQVIAHTQIGHDMLANTHREILNIAATIAHQHHEYYDGNGYPQALKGEQIHIFARITAIVDIYDILSVERSYRPAWKEQQILEYIEEQKGKQFDPQLVDIFLAHIEQFREIRANKHRTGNTGTD